jgi:DNA-binding response OmpR family regulator
MMIQQALSKKSIMVIDDEPGRLRLITLFLKHAGFVPLPVRNSTNAIEALELLIPDLFVISADLEDGNGLDLFHRIRTSLPTTQSPLLVLTMSSDDCDLSDSTLVNDTLSVPFISHELIERIHNLFALQEAV